MIHIAKLEFNLIVIHSFEAKTIMIDRSNIAQITRAIGAPSHMYPCSANIFVNATTAHDNITPPRIQYNPHARRIHRS